MKFTEEMDYLVEGRAMKDFWSVLEKNDLKWQIKGIYKDFVWRNIIEE